MISERLIELRKATGLSQKAFGGKINLSQTHIASLENGKRVLTPRVIQDICRAFHVNENWLVNGEGSMRTDVLKGLTVDDDIRQLVNKYNLLSEKDKALVRDIVNSFMEKKR